jgi:hypothetical protein
MPGSAFAFTSARIMLDIQVSLGDLLIHAGKAACLPTLCTETAFVKVII